MTTNQDLMAAIAVTRFGLGAKPGEIDQARSDPQGFLRAQIRPSGADQPQANPESSVDRLLAFREFQQYRLGERQGQAGSIANRMNPARRRRGRQGQQPPTQAMQDQAGAYGAQAGSDMQAQAGGGDMAGALGTQFPPPRPGNERDPVQIAGRMIREHAGRDFLARILLATNTDAGFRERWHLFWANHFTVAASKLVSAVLVGPYEQEAIRPAVFGSFEQLLINGALHPGMMLYLDQAQSVGPHSIGAGYVRRQQGGGGLNENLAREILELHTVGLGAGYSQTDVTEFARALTGWSVGGLRDGDRQGRFIYRQIVHEPGARTVLGRTYQDTGASQAINILKDLARNPHTARHIARKVAIHFVADDPPASLVARLEQSFLTTNGDLSALANTLISSPEAWEPTPRKFKTPYEFVVSSWRSSGAVPRNLLAIGPTLNGMGQQPFNAPSPKGWSEEAQHWAAPDAIVRRMTWADAYSVAAIGTREPMDVARATLGARLTSATTTAISRAESRSEGYAILLMSPEFLRR